MALQPVDGALISATISFEDVARGAKVSVDCRYNRADVAPDGGWRYVFVVSTDDTEAPLSSWRAFLETTA